MLIKVQISAEKHIQHECAAYCEKLGVSVMIPSPWSSPARRTSQEYLMRGINVRDQTTQLTAPTTSSREGLVLLRKILR